MWVVFSLTIVGSRLLIVQVQVFTHRNVSQNSGMSSSTSKLAYGPLVDLVLKENEILHQYHLYFNSLFCCLFTFFVIHRVCRFSRMLKILQRGRERVLIWNASCSDFDKNGEFEVCLGIEPMCLLEL